MGHSLSVQTVFTAPTACATNNLLTQTASDTILWNNIIQPAANITASSCYPSQFVTSALSTNAYAPFAQLICPALWNTYSINSTYIICCPSGYGLWAPNITNTERPATEAWCSSNIASGVQYDVVKWGSSGINTTLAVTATDWNGIAWATPFDGIMATTTLASANSTSSTSSGSSPSRTISTVPSSTVSQTSTAATSGHSTSSATPLSTLP